MMKSILEDEIRTVSTYYLTTHQKVYFIKLTVYYYLDYFNPRPTI